MDFSAARSGRFGSAFERLGVERAWTRTRGGQVVIGIVDRGVQADHPLLGPNIRDHEHARGASGEHEIAGTHAAGIAAGRPCAAGEFAGVAPEARILPVRIGSGAGVQAPDLPHAIEYAAEMGASIINLPAGSELATHAILRAVQYAAARNALVVCGAHGAPAARAREVDDPLPNVITVASFGDGDDGDVLGARAPGAPRAARIADIAAPAFARVPQWRGEGHATVRHETLAVPYVSGCAALIKALNPGWGYHEIKEHLLVSADPATRMLDVANAVLGPVQLESEPNLRWSSLNDAQVRWSLRYRSGYCAQVSVLYRPTGDDHWRELASGRAGSMQLTVPARAMRTSTGKMRLACRESNFYSDEVTLTIR